MKFGRPRAASSRRSPRCFRRGYFRQEAWRLPGIGLVCLLLVSCGEAGLPERGGGHAESGCRVARVIDGDTMDMDCGQGVERVRLVGFDTPEKFSPRCREEYVRALEAERHLAALVREGDVRAKRRGVDRYGRTLARVQVGKKDVAAEMIAAGLARPYSGGLRRGWCA